MAVAFGSIATVETANIDLTIGKPTGLAAGDLMIAAIMNMEDNTDYTLSGWTLLDEDEAPASHNMSLLWKIATAGDVAASDFTFDNSSGGNHDQCGFIMRITGSGFTGAANIKLSGITSVAAPNVSFTGVTPLGTNSLLILGAGFDATSSRTASGYAVVNSNPTWTERADVPHSGDNDGGICVATAIYAPNTPTGNASFTVSGDGSAYCFLISVQENTSAAVSGATGTLTLSGNVGTVTAAAAVA